MDRLSIFPNPITEIGKVTLSSENSLDDVIERQTDILRELKVTRKGNEEWLWENKIEDSTVINWEELEAELEGIDE